MTSTIDIDKLPTIPKDWDLTDEQRASMIAAQKKNMALDRNKAVSQKNQLNQFMQHSAMSPPEYPILVLVKQNNKITQNYYLTDNNNNYLYATTFDDATSTVKVQLADPNSALQKVYAKNNPGNKLRISSDNKKGPTKIGDFSMIPNSNYKYWTVTTTNAAPSFFSSMRQSLRGGKRTRKSKKSKKSRKSKRRMR
jgi:hypothetical protein